MHRAKKVQSTRRIYGAHEMKEMQEIQNIQHIKNNKNKGKISKANRANKTSKANKTKETKGAKEVKRELLMQLIFILILIFILTTIPTKKTRADEYLDGPADMDINDFETEDCAVSLESIPIIDAAAAIVMDTETGRVLFEKNAYSRRPIASTTKIMTGILAIEMGDLNDEVTVSKGASRIWGSVIDLQQGEKLKLGELLYGLMLSSGNDAAIAIAEHIGGTLENFLEMMNKKARLIGARNTNFKSPHGLDMEGHYSTAYDIALITRYALENPIFSKIVATKQAVIPKRNLYNTNEMLEMYHGADGVKTGYTGKQEDAL